MQLEVTLKTSDLPESMTPAGATSSGWSRVLSRLPSFVFPWSPMVRMTGAVLTETGLTLAHGRVRGSNFRVDAVTRVTDSQETASLVRLSARRGEPVCVCLPRSRTLVRHFRIPTGSQAEIEAMLPHLLAGELPMALELYSWVWTVLPSRHEGTSLIACHIARCDRLTELLTPLSAADLNVVGFIPEGWVWAHAMGEVRDSSESESESSPRSFIISGDFGPYLVVARNGKPLFDALLPATALQKPEDVAESDVWRLDWDGSGMAEVRGEFRDLMNIDLPEPELWSDTFDALTEGDKHDMYHCASVAAAGLSHDRLLMPPDVLSRNRRRTFTRALTNLAWIGMLAVLLWSVFAGYEDHRTHRYLETLNRQFQDEAPRVEALAAEFEAVRNSTRSRAGNTEVLQALDGLRRDVKSPIYLEHLNYVQGQGLTLRGGAPKADVVLEMAEQLALDPLWSGWRVTQLRTENFNDIKRIHFVAEGQLRERVEVGDTDE